MILLGSSNRRVAARAFTLIELLLVMALLTVVMALVSPSLGPFLRGRSVGYEVRRFIHLTRLAQARAANEGVPMRLWVDPDLRMYGMGPEFSMDATMTTTPAPIPGQQQPASGGRSVAYPLASDVQVEADPRSWATMSGNTFALQFRWAAGQGAFAQGRRFSFRFTPDGGIDETSPWGIWFRGNADPNARTAARSGDEVYVSQNYARTRYEVQTNQLAIPVR